MGPGIQPCVRCGFVERVEEVCVRTRLSWIVLGPVAARAPQSKIFEKRILGYSFTLFLSSSRFLLLRFFGASSAKLSCLKGSFQFFSFLNCTVPAGGVSTYSQPRV